MKIPNQKRGKRRAPLLKAKTEEPPYFYCGPCPECGKKGIPRGRGENAYCVCPIHGKYEVTYTEGEIEQKEEG